MLHNVLESRYSMLIKGASHQKKKKPVENPRASKMLPSPLGKKPAGQTECRFSSKCHPLPLG
jgi:hypothetical protein